MSGPSPVEAVSSFDNKSFDCVVVVTDLLDNLTGDFDFLKQAFSSLVEVDATVGKDVLLAPLAGPFKRVVFACTGPLNRDYDDVRRFYDAAFSGINRALKAGSKAPLLVTVENERFVHAPISAALGALQALYVPLEIREGRPEKKIKAGKLGLYSKTSSEKLAKFAAAFESGRHLTRDIQGSDPERMAPPRVAQHVTQYFEGTSIKVEVIADVDYIEKNYPCLGAVNRCAKVVPRHNARVVKLSYEGEGPITDTLFLVGKGVTYDTGGADVKAGGIMAGMHRDKGGASAVAGLFAVLEKLKPKHLKVYGTMSMVRNSIGSNGYVADEIITSRAGVRVRVGNTDAEGRMAMVDCLCEAKEIALSAVNPQLYTVATLTGHAIIAVGQGYTLAMDNGPAKAANNATLLRNAGDEIGDMFELSTIRREDYEFHTGKSEYEDVLQCNNSPSSRTPRGHQSPSAFMIMTSGLDKHGIDSKQPLKYTHLDIAGSEGKFPGVPTGSPVPALCFHHFPAQ
uniref:Putative aminopeptidase W07G4.4 n=1 Tax=Phallusia mammillata TaxID=59560 RepID=A0A6F9DIY1_9ASCI|nr:putative aminopeptidase W07G4.4 [Phallusia mammillata]